MFSSLILSGAALAIFQTIPTALAFPTTPDGNSITNSGYGIQDDLLSLNITSTDTDTDSTNAILGTRAMNSRDIIRVDCDNNNNGANTKWGYALAKYVAQGVKHLKGVSGTPTNGPGPGNCGRVSCSWGAAIYWCNDAPRVGKELNSYSEIAWAAQEVQKRCYHSGQSTGTPANVNNNGGYLKGAVYMRDQWSVIVRADHDNC